MGDNASIVQSRQLLCKLAEFLCRLKFPLRETRNSATSYGLGRHQD